MVRQNWTGWVSNLMGIPLLMHLSALSPLIGEGGEVEGEVMALQIVQGKDLGCWPREALSGGGSNYLLITEPSCIIITHSYFCHGCTKDWHNLEAGVLVKHATTHMLKDRIWKGKSCHLLGRQQSLNFCLYKSEETGSLGRLLWHLPWITAQSELGIAKAMAITEKQ